MINDCCAGTSNRDTLSDLLQQTEKQLYSIGAIVGEIENKINGQQPCCENGGNQSLRTAPGLYDQAEGNLAILNNINIGLARITERL